MSQELEQVEVKTEQEEVVPKSATPKKDAREDISPDSGKTEDSEKSRSHQDTEESQEDLEAVHQEPDTDEEGNDKTVSVKRLKAMAKQAKSYQGEIKGLKEQLDNSVPIYDVDVFRKKIGSPSDFSSTEEYENIVNGYVNQLVADNVKHHIRASRAVSNLAMLSDRAGIDLNNLPVMSEEKILLTGESPAAAHIASMLMDNSELAEAYTKASPEEVKAFIKQTEGQLQADQARQQQEMQKLSQEKFDHFTSNVEAVTSGRLSTSDLKHIEMPQIAAEAMQSMKGGAELAVYLNDKPEMQQRLKEVSKISPYAALVELGRMEQRAIIYTKSNDFAKKYPKTKAFAADTALKGGATAPKGLNVNDDAEFNRRYNSKKTRK
ncbi:MAG: hypothetical protein AAGJ90_19720 [Pseudomonadota bacterium]